MSTGFSPETRRILAAHRPAAPLFSNQIAAELFDAKYTREPYKVLPRTDGGFVVIDERLEVGARTVSKHATPDAALQAIERRLARAPEAA